MSNLENHIEQAQTIINYEQQFDGSRPETRHTVEVAKVHALIAIAEQLSYIRAELKNAATPAQPPARELV